MQTFCRHKKSDANMKMNSSANSEMLNFAGVRGFSKHIKSFNDYSNFEQYCRHMSSASMINTVSPAKFLRI